MEFFSRVRKVKNINADTVEQVNLYSNYANATELSTSPQFRRRADIKFVSQEPSTNEIKSNKSRKVYKLTANKSNISSTSSSDLCNSSTNSQNEPTIIKIPIHQQDSNTSTGSGDSGIDGSVKTKVGPQDSGTSSISCISGQINARSEFERRVHEAAKLAYREEAREAKQQLLKQQQQQFAGNNEISDINAMKVNLRRAAIDCDPKKKLSEDNVDKNAEKNFKKKKKKVDDSSNPSADLIESDCSEPDTDSISDSDSCLEDAIVSNMSHHRKESRTKSIKHTRRSSAADEKNEKLSSRENSIQSNADEDSGRQNSGDFDSGHTSGSNSNSDKELISSDSSDKDVEVKRVVNVESPEVKLEKSPVTLPKSSKNSVDQNNSKVIAKYTPKPKQQHNKYYHQNKQIIINGNPVKNENYASPSKHSALAKSANLTNRIQPTSRRVNGVTLRDLYSLRAVLSDSDNGTVFSGRRRIDNAAVAIKRIMKSKVKRWHMIKEKSVPMEIALLRKVNETRHPGVVTLLEWFECSDCFLLVMARPTPVLDLFDFVSEKKRLDEQTSKIIFAQVVEAMFHCHNRSVLHRDIKLENILVKTDSLISTIIDFGCGTHLHSNLYKDFAGTPQYYPPEYYICKQYHGLPAAVWSCGVMLYAMLCGRLPFASAHEIVHLEPSWHGSFCRKISSQAKDLVEQMLKKQPRRRLNMNEILKHKWLKNIKYESLTGAVTIMADDNKTVVAHSSTIMSTPKDNTF